MELQRQSTTRQIRYNTSSVSHAFIGIVLAPEPLHHRRDNQTHVAGHSPAGHCLYRLQPGCQTFPGGCGRGTPVDCCPSDRTEQHYRDGGSTADRALPVHYRHPEPLFPGFGNGGHARLRFRGESRVIRSIILLSVLVSIIVGVISLYARPWAYRQSYQIEAEARAEFDIRKIEPGRFIELQGSKYVLFARDVDKKKGRLKEVFLQSEKGDKIQVTYAREALLPPVRAGEQRSFVFHDGYSYLLDQHGSKDTTLKFGELIVPIPEVTKDVSYRRKAEPTASLARSQASKDIAEFQWRTSTPFATLILALIAVPLSRSSPRQSRYHSFVVAILVYVGLFILTSASRNWVADGKIPDFPGLWWVYTLPLLLFAGLMGVPALQRWRN